MVGKNWLSVMQTWISPGGDENSTVISNTADEVHEHPARLGGMPDSPGSVVVRKTLETSEVFDMVLRVSGRAVASSSTAEPIEGGHVGGSMVLTWVA